MRRARRPSRARGVRGEGVDVRAERTLGEARIPHGVESVPARPLYPNLVAPAVVLERHAVVLFFYQLGDGSLYDWDEATYAQIAKAMVLSQTWGTLYWNGTSFFEKPPLYSWLTALTYQVLGINE